MSWLSQQQRALAFSSPEAEYIAMCSETKEEIWLRWVIWRLVGRDTSMGMHLNVDTQGEIFSIKKYFNKTSRTTLHPVPLHTKYGWGKKCDFIIYLYGWYASVHTEEGVRKSEGINVMCILHYKETCDWRRVLKQWETGTCFEWWKNELKLRKNHPKGRGPRPRKHFRFLQCNKLLTIISQLKFYTGSFLQFSIVDDWPFWLIILCDWF